MADSEPDDDLYQEDTEAVLEEGDIEGENDSFKFIQKHHPECSIDYVEQVYQKVGQKSYPPGKEDKTHKSVPYVTIYEKTKIIGFRSNQLAQGAKPFINVPPHITNVTDIARLEFDQRRLPFIIKRPMPDGTFEYWRLQDLLIL